MSTSADTFADFVDHLAEALDGTQITEATGEEWAARLHFSRSYFDRMIR
jgi:AraC family transcriptional regulator